ncbi:SDR family oxidoreductase [Alkalilimnicola sp. S0819]|uniref:SDR family oxidoreductase n=1 Tax=Alkalilimnicola sp. S0819 TaxID=2613922 RepID=UPI0012627DD4|nr:SDR family oxidoreductase [Alkalilimnicola sp. S0819]KAB7624360.1 SDR family oxidoreductase [Alkalilimnicola sp. S0819]MPQ16186.1 SDR family NAD(P)-dependent oxidoreductase [Alkalilimnicola sp. S0819]
MSRIALITGASSGFGEATARRLAGAGWRLILAARRRERLEALQQELGGAAQAHLLELDVSRRAQVEARLGDLPADFADIEVLVNNAGVGLGLEPAWRCDPDEWETMIDTNIKGMLHVTRTVLPGMVARRRGHIVNLGSIAGDWPYPGGNVYGGTKAFVKQFSRNLRADLLGLPLRVTNLEPGLCETEFSINRFRGDRDRADSLYRGNDPILAEDIAEAVHWVVSLPRHVNINRMEIMPVSQSWGALPVKTVDWSD